MDKYARIVRSIIGLIIPLVIFYFMIDGAIRMNNFKNMISVSIIWIVLLSIMPIISIVDKFKRYPEGKINYGLLFYNTFGTFWSVISFGLAIFALMIIDYFKSNIQFLISNTLESNIMLICIIISIMFVLIPIVYSISNKNKVKRLKAIGQKIMVDAEVKRDLIMSMRSPLLDVYNVYAEVVNPYTAKLTKLIGRTFGNSNETIPKSFPVYFNPEKPSEYYFDTYSWMSGNKYC